MDTYTPNNTPIISDTNGKHKRSYKVDSRYNRHWVELLENGRMACILTVENERVATATRPPLKKLHSVSFEFILVNQSILVPAIPIRKKRHVLTLFVYAL